MFGNKDIPVYLFTGFLESGKTTCIQEVIEEGNFSDGAKTLLILCEEGEHEIEDELLMANRISCVVVEDEDEFTEDVCMKLQEKYKPDRIVIEYNGMWNIDKLSREILPEHWFVVQTFTTVNALTYEMYSNNMKPLLMAHFQMSDLVIFNRCMDAMDKAAARRSVKAINRRAQVLFEAEDGTVESDIAEQLPYDINASVITLEDDDFGLWYLDVSEHPEKYAGKTMVFKGQVYRTLTFPKDAFVPSRQAMTCCEDDIAKIGFMCHYDKTNQLKSDSWVTVTAEVKVKRSRRQDSDYPVLYAKKVEAAEPPEEELVYFG